MFAWDNYLTHALKTHVGRLELQTIVTGEIVTYNDIGQVAGRKPLQVYQTDKKEKKSTRFPLMTAMLSANLLVIHDVLSFDGTPVDKELLISQRLALFANVKNDRVSVMPFEN